MNSEPSVRVAKALVLDANILVRAVLGRRVLPLLDGYAATVSFLAPEIAFADARAHLLNILERRGVPTQRVTQLLGSEVFGRLPELVSAVPLGTYADAEPDARQRLARRDESDWPFLALALKRGCSIWTENQDFFGTGVATWTTNRVEIYLKSP